MRSDAASAALRKTCFDHEAAETVSDEDQLTYLQIRFHLKQTEHIGRAVVAEPRQFDTGAS